MEKKTKVCTGCKEDLPYSSYYMRTDKRRVPYKIKLRSKCKVCELVDSRAYRKNNPHKMKEFYETKKTERRARKYRAVEYKGGKCQECGNKFHIAAYDFHHLNPDEKAMDPGLMLQSTDEVLFKELDKCMLLCANCHRILHYERGDLGKIKKGKRKS